MIYPIRLYGDPVLRRRARPVQDFSGIKKLAEDMLETMFEARGVGLAAPQIGLSERLFVAVEYADEPEGEERPLRDLVRQVYVVANPVIIHREGEVEGLEGCLSLPGLYAEEVPRAERIRVEYQDEEGGPAPWSWRGIWPGSSSTRWTTWTVSSSSSACLRPSGRPSWRKTGRSWPGCRRRQGPF